MKLEYSILLLIYKSYYRNQSIEYFIRDYKKLIKIYEEIMTEDE